MRRINDDNDNDHIYDEEVAAGYRRISGSARNDGPFGVYGIRHDATHKEYCSCNHRCYACSCATRRGCVLSCSAVTIFG